MFAEACRKVSEYTRPLVISTRRQDGTVTTEVGTFIVLNREGWILTAAHMYDAYETFQRDQRKIAEINEINANRVDSPGSPKSELKLDPEFITNHSFWWGWDGVRVDHGYYDRHADLFVGKLDRFDPRWVSEYPVLRDPATLRPGTSLCRSGFPFMDIKSEWNEANKGFVIPRIDSNTTIFHNDGIHTRTVDKGPSHSGKFPIRLVETSSPGHKGQSGGPIFDTDGRLYAMQIKTASLPLGYRPYYEQQGRTVVTEQFVNIGLGVHVGTIIDFLESHDVGYESECRREEYKIVS